MYCAIALASMLVLPTNIHALDPASSPITAQGTLQAAFAPWDNVEGIIIDTIGGAKKQVLVQAYLLTSKKVAAALIAAHRRSVDVRVLADAKQHERTESSKLSVLATAGIPVSLETKYQNAHNKVIVIDAGTSNPVLITGSFNFTWTAQHKNAENILVARHNSSLVARYLLNWERHQQDASPYKK
jgi:phosphatidylserine/phosphatidylglycerophosphate/cardiolipin synthase-like enzyme